MDCITLATDTHACRVPWPTSPLAKTAILRKCPFFFLFVAGLWGSALPARAQSKPLSPAEAPKHMTLPDGFQVSLFVGEPDVVQPIAFTFDDRGRVWVAECLSYPKWQSDFKAGKDRIVIFEEGDDGTHKKRTVFADNIQNISGINSDRNGKVRLIPPAV